MQPHLSAGDTVLNKSDTEPPTRCHQMRALGDVTAAGLTYMMPLNSHMTHFTDREPEAQRGAQVCLRSHIRECQSQGSRLDSLCPIPLLPFPLPFPVLTQAHTEGESKHGQKAPVSFVLCLFFLRL